MTEIDSIITTELQKFDVPAEAIATMKEQYLPLTINGVDDKEGFDKVHEARMKVKGIRIDVEKRRVELKEDSLKYGRAVDGEAKRITGLLSPIEAHLEAEEKRIVEEKERIKEEARLWSECKGAYQKVMSRQLATLMGALDFDGLPTPTATISMPKQPKEGDSVSILGHNFEYKPAVVEDLSKEVEEFTKLELFVLLLLTFFAILGAVTVFDFLLDLIDRIFVIVL